MLSGECIWGPKNRFFFEIFSPQKIEKNRIFSFFSKSHIFGLFSFSRQNARRARHRAHVRACAAQMSADILLTIFCDIVFFHHPFYTYTQIWSVPKKVQCKSMSGSTHMSVVQCVTAVCCSVKWPTSISRLLGADFTNFAEFSYLYIFPHMPPGPHKLCTLTHIFARMDTIESLCPSKFQSNLDRTSNMIYLTCLEAVEYNS